MEFTVPAMSCNHCVKAITQAVAEVAPKARVAIDLETKRVRVEEADAQAPQIEAAIIEAGYEVEG